jgi:hypothetical protein
MVNHKFLGLPFINWKLVTVFVTIQDVPQSQLITFEDGQSPCQSKGLPLLVLLNHSLGKPSKFALHVYIATAFTDPGALLNEAQAARILDGFGLEGAIDPSGLVRQNGALYRWISLRWPDCRRHEEIPVESILPSGQFMHGRIGLLLEVADDWVLLDHKANLASRDRWDQVAMEHAEQLSEYADALFRATGRSVTEVWIVLPVAAGAIQIPENPYKNSWRSMFCFFFSFPRH